MINEGAGAARQGDPPSPPGPYQLQAAIAALHARAKRAEDTDWAEIELLYAALERVQPSPVVTLQPRRRGLASVRGPQRRWHLIEPLGEKLDGYFYYHGLRGGLLKQLGRARRGARGLRSRHCACQHSRRKPPTSASRSTASSTGRRSRSRNNSQTSYPVVGTGKPPTSL